MKLLKCHGSSNDFFIVDESRDPLNEARRGDLTVALCDRSGPLGADGVLFVRRESDGSFGMRIINADGGEAEMCGNGLRCVGRYVLDLAGFDRVPIRTMKETIEICRAPEIAAGVYTIEYESRSLSFELSTLPMNHDAPTAIEVPIAAISRDRHFTAVSVPNPHVISIVDRIDLDELDHVGHAAQHAHDVFPNGVNVSFVEVLGPQAIYVSTYERGVGRTEACGTAMSASCVVATKYGGVDAGVPTDIFTDGGMIRCTVSNPDGATIVRPRGNATYTYRTEIDTDALLADALTLIDIDVVVEEISAYDRFLNDARGRLGVMRRAA